MEPISLTTIAIAVTTIFFTKVVEQSGEEFGKFLLNKAKTLKAELSDKSNKVKGLLEPESNTSLQFPEVAEAILEVQKIAKENPQIAQTIIDVESEAVKEPNGKFQQEVKEVKQEVAKLGTQQPTIQNLTKLAEKIVSVNQGYIEKQEINIENF